MPIPLSVFKTWPIIDTDADFCVLLSSMSDSIKPALTWNGCLSIVIKKAKDHSNNSVIDITKKSQLQTGFKAQKYQQKKTNLFQKRNLLCKVVISITSLAVNMTITILGNKITSLKRVLTENEVRESSHHIKSYPNDNFPVSIYRFMASEGDVISCSLCFRTQNSRTSYCISKILMEAYIVFLSDRLFLLSEYSSPAKVNAVSLEVLDAG